MNIAYSCNDYYIPQTGISMISVLENNKSEDINFYFISKNCSNNNLKVLQEICNLYRSKLIILDFDTIAYDLNISNVGRHIETIYAKIFFSRINNLDKIIYLDSDIIVRGSLKDLWGVNLSGYYLAAVQTFTKSKPTLGIPNDAPFFNDGMVVQNVDFCRKNKLIEKAKGIISEYNGNPPVLSEGVLNKICIGKVKYVSIKYNMMSGILYHADLNKKSLIESLNMYSKTDIEESLENPICIHFLSAFYNRPWNYPCTHPYKNEYFKYKSLSPWRHIEPTRIPIPKKLKLIDLCYKILGQQFTDFIRRCFSYL